MTSSEPLKIGIIGAGNIGGALARHFVDAGHEVTIANSRGPETLTELVDQLGPHAHAATAEQAAEFGDIVVVSVPLVNYEQIPVAPTAGKVVIDTNNYYPQRDGQIPELDSKTTTSSELLAAHLPTSQVVKAFNQIQSQRLVEDGTPTGTTHRTAIPIAGDDAAAKATVMALIDQIGFDAVDTGPLNSGRLFQPGAPLYVADITADKIRQAMATVA